MTDDPLAKLWPFLAALAGSYVALSLEKFRNLTPSQKLGVVVSSFLGTIFLGPLVINYKWPNEPPDSRIIGSFYFFLGVSFMSALPFLVEKLVALVQALGAALIQALGGKKGGGE